MTKTSETDAVMEIYEPFLSDGSVSLNSDFAHSTPIKILRDTGASQSLNVPLHNIYLSSDYVTGLVAVGIRPSLHFKGVHLL